MPVPVTSQDPSQHTGPKDSIWNRRSIILLGSVLLAGCIFAAYHNTFAVPYLLDDADSIEKNKTIRSLATAFSPPTNSGITVSGRPLLNLSLAINYRLSGTGLFGYHLGNLLIHFAAALSLFGVVRRTLQLPAMAARYGKHATLLAWFSAVLWALHPLQTESVTYIIQRAESLVGLCYLFTLYAFIRAVEKPSRMWPVITVIACLLGMAAKEVMASAPLVIFLFDRTFVSGTFRESWMRHKSLFLGLAATWLLLGLLVVTSGGRGDSVGFARVSPWDYALTQTTAIVQYLKLSFWPQGLIFDYGATIEKRPAVLMACTFILLPLLVGTVFALKKRPAAGFLAATFFLILGPTSSIIPVATQTIAEHRMYLPLAAIIGGFAVTLYSIRRRSAVVVAVSILAIALGFLSFRRNQTYQSTNTIWEDTVEKMPDNVRALNNLAVTYLEKERIDEAVQRLSEALDLVPDFGMACCNLGRALIYQALKDAGLERSPADLTEGVEFGGKRASPDELLASEKVRAGLGLLDKSIRLEPSNALFFAHYGNALLALRQPEAALEKLEASVALDPTSRDAVFDLANTLSRLDRNEKASECFQAALALKPDEPEALTNFGALLRRMGRLPESIDQLRKAAQLAPQSARTHSNLGVSLLEAGFTDEGIRELREALRLNGNLPQARYNLSNALAETGQTEEAIVHLEVLLNIAPPTAELTSNLGVLYARIGRLDQAVEQLQRALRLDPQYEPATENLEKISAFLRSRRTP